MAGANGKAAVVLDDVDKNGFANEIVTRPARAILGVTIEGVSKLLMHKYDCEDVAAKGKAAKGSAEKKSDNVESYVYRNEDANLCIPAENLHASLATSAKSFQDPRSPRKSAMDLFKAGILVLPDLLTLKRPDGEPYPTWDFTDTRRVVVSQSAVSRTRPGLEAGWRLDADIQILVPGLIGMPLLRDVLANAGAVVGLCDFRPRFGRFQITRAEVVNLN